MNESKEMIKELQAIRMLLQRMADHMNVPKPEPKKGKPWGSVTSITKSFGRTVTRVTDDPDVPAQLSEEDRRVVAAQDSDKRLKTGEWIRDTQPVKPVEQPPVMFTDEQIENFREFLERGR